MNKSWVYLGLIGSLSLVVTSCGDGGGKVATPAASPSAAASPVAVAPVTPAPVIAPTPAVVAAAPVVPATTQKVNINSAGLIPVTDPDSWTKTVTKGRSDPFGSLSLQAIVVTDKTDGLPQIANQQPTAKTRTASANVTPIKSGTNKPLPKIKITKIATLPPAGSIENADTVDIFPSSSSNTGHKSSQKTAAKSPTSRKPTVIAIKPTIPSKPASKTTIALKPVPQPFKDNTAPTIPTVAAPEIASTIGVSGVIEVDGRTQVILKLPNEPFSRYVAVGDRIYDGKIIVKRVEGEQTLSPLVILEEGGVEVSRRVGDLGSSVTQEASK